MPSNGRERRSPLRPVVCPTLVDVRWCDVNKNLSHIPDRWRCRSLCHIPHRSFELSSVSPYFLVWRQVTRVLISSNRPTWRERERERLLIFFLAFWEKGKIRWSVRACRVTASRYFLFKKQSTSTDRDESFVESCRLNQSQRSFVIGWNNLRWMSTPLTIERC